MEETKSGTEMALREAHAEREQIILADAERLWLERLAPILKMTREQLLKLYPHKGGG